jgi:hypothetical protein
VLTGCKLRLALLAGVALLGACAHGVRPPAAPPSATSAAPPPAGTGRVYTLVPAESLLTVLVYRAGPLANLGHNHVVASHELSGAIRVASDVLRSTCELRVPVASLTVDEPALRAREGADFAAEVPPSAREGTRQNMLGPALLDAGHYPLIGATCGPLAADASGGATGGASGGASGGATGGASPAGALNAPLQIEVRGMRHLLSFPLRYQRRDGALQVDGSLTVRHSDLGLTPFSVMLGALRVQEEMTVRLHLVARPTP